MIQSDEITGPDLQAKTGTHRGNVMHWAGVAGVAPLRIEAYGGRNVNVWPLESVEKINAARKARGVPVRRRSKRAR